MKIRLMTSNIWGNYFGNPVEPRAPLLQTVYERYAPDVLGLQEVTGSWWESDLIPYLKSQFEQVPLDFGKYGNHTPLFYRADKLELLDKSCELFHPELDSSKGWNCGVFREKTSGQIFAVFNTHFWWKIELHDDIIRRYNAMEMAAEMRQIGEKYHCPVFFMGDLNCKIRSLAWNFLEQQGWTTSYRCTEDFSHFSSNHHDPEIHPDGTCTGCTTDEPVENTIDHIGIPAGVRVLRQFAVADREALDASDHSPVFADIEFETSK